MRKRVVIIILSAIILVTALALILNFFVLLSARQSIVDADSLQAEKYDAILVLGAGILNNERPSDMLKDRLDTAIALYNSGVSDLLVLSGDCSGEDYDEVAVMSNYCISQGVPIEAIREDKEGFSTVESVHNIKYKLGYGRVVIVTQKYHLYRALYIAQNLGIDAQGISADIRSYRGQLWRDAREIAARIKDFLIVGFKY